MFEFKKAQVLAQFQQLINEILKGLSFAFGYLDGIILVSILANTSNILESCLIGQR